MGFEPTDRLITDQTISSRSRYDLFDTSPCCIPNALRVSLTNKGERRKRRTKRRKTVDMKLLKSVDEPESPEVPRDSEVGPSTNPHDFECGPFNHLGTSPWESGRGFQRLLCHIFTADAREKQGIPRRPPSYHDRNEANRKPFQQEASFHETRALSSRHTGTIPQLSPGGECRRRSSLLLRRSG